MQKEQLITAFIDLGKRLKNLKEDELQEWKRGAAINNKWFTENNVLKAIEGITFMLEKENLEKWINNYSIPAKNSKKIGVVMAGNIPMVGFHDLLCVLISGHILLAKLSSDDSFLMQKLIALLCETEPSFQAKIQLTERLNDADALIATGSDNTAKHFDYYFSKIPRIVRRNRVSVAILIGNETQEELTALGGDIFQYFGLGCRNVSKLFIPKNMTLNHIYEALEPWKHVVDSVKYSNNYEYNRSIFLLKSVLHLDNGFLLAVETKELVSAIAVFYYEKYNSIDEVAEIIENQKEKIQCIVAKDGVLENTVPFGSTQHPFPWNYADGVDTMSFLLNFQK